MKSIAILSFLLLNIVLTRGSNDYSMTDFENLSAKRSISLKNKIIRVENEVLIKSTKVDPIYSYRYILNKNASQSLIHLSAKMSLENQEPIDLEIKKSSEDADYIYYDISLKNFPMNYEEERTIVVKEDYFEKLQFYPKKIQIKDDQYALYKDSLNYLSAYQTNQQEIVVTLPNENTSLVKYTMTRLNKIYQ